MDNLGSIWRLTIEAEVRSRFPDLNVHTVEIVGVDPNRDDSGIAGLEAEVLADVRSKYSVDSLKDVAVFRLYRDFFWKIGTDPTKNRPASEALVRRTLAGKPIPRINTVVDVYNLVSLETGIPLAAFDAERLEGSLTMKLSRPGESFVGIGMDGPMSLQGGEVVVSDEEKLVAIYPYRDADSSKVTRSTRRVVVMVCGAPGVDLETLKKAGQRSVECLTRFCGGVAGQLLENI